MASALRRVCPLTSSFGPVSFRSRPSLTSRDRRSSSAGPICRCNRTRNPYCLIPAIPRLLLSEGSVDICCGTVLYFSFAAHSTAPPRWAQSLAPHHPQRRHCCHLCWYLNHMVGICVVGCDLFERHHRPIQASLHSLRVHGLRQCAAVSPS